MRLKISQRTHFKWLKEGFDMESWMLSKNQKNVFLVVPVIQDVDCY